MQASTAGVPTRRPEAARPGLRAFAHRSRYVGWRHRCPVCTSHVRSFVPGGVKSPLFDEQLVIGGGWRRAASCPVCWSTDRDRLVLLFLRHRTPLFDTPCRLLHIAPEPGIEAEVRAAGTIDYLTADLSGEGVMIALDLTDTGLPDASFDAVIGNHVLEHIPDDRAAMAEVLRLLRPGGWAILQVPIALAASATVEDPSVDDPGEREQRFGQRDHVRLYGSDYTSRLAAAGFDVEAFDWRTDPTNFGGARNRHGLLPDERVFLATKPDR